MAGPGRFVLIPVCLLFLFFCSRNSMSHLADSVTVQSPPPSPALAHIVS